MQAQPERIVDKMLDQAIDKITVQELLRLSPDLLHKIWGMQRFPPLNKTTSLSTQLADIDLGASLATTGTKGLERLQRV